MKTLARDRDTAELLLRLRALRQDSVRRWGRMSAHQMVCHLTDGYRLMIGQRSTRLAASPLPRPIMKWIALYAPIRWPRGVPTTPDLDQTIDGTAPVDFDADVAELRALLHDLAADPHARFGGRLHPIFGPMSGSAWMRWAYLHADHHLRQFGV